VTGTPEVRRVVNAAFADPGRIDVVINNVGYGLFGAAKELTDEQKDLAFSTDFPASA